MSEATTSRPDSEAASLDHLDLADPYLHELAQQVTRGEMTPEKAIELSRQYRLGYRK